MKPAFFLPLQALYSRTSHFPWKNTARTLGQRFREDRLGLTAGSLTFTTLIALIPFITVALAVFTAFPMFAKTQDVLQKWLVESLVPEHISRQLLGYLTQFAGKANKLGLAGGAVLFATALTAILTIDRTLNSIWRVQRQRPLAQRILIYWAAITLGPLLLGASLSLSTYLISSSKELVGGVPGLVLALLDTLEFFVVAAALALTYRFVPHTPVKWSHAWIGGIFVGVGIELAKKMLALYLGSISSYAAVYGAFATVPILLIWIYLVWVTVLLGAVIAAYLPSLLSGVVRHSHAYGWHFELALEVVAQLERARNAPARGCTTAELALALQLDTLQLEPVLQTLSELDWLGRVGATDGRSQERWVLLVPIAATALQPLVEKLLIGDSLALQTFYQKSLQRPVTLADMLS